MYQVFFISNRKNFVTGIPELEAIGRPCKTRKGANRKKDKLDNDFGAYKHTGMELTVN